MNDIVTTSDTPTAAPKELTTQSIWESFQEMAKDPSIDPVKMETMYQLQKSIIEDQRVEEFNQSKFLAMDEMPTIIKNKIVSNKSNKVMYRYSDFKHLYLTVKPILAKHSMVLDFDVDETNNETKVPFLRVAPILRHKNGYVWHGSYMPVPITAANSSISMTQASKGAVETGKRTVLISCLGITEEETEEITGQMPQQITQEFQHLVDQGQVAASNGSLEYRTWMAGLTNAQKGWLVANDHHENLSRAAKMVDSQ